MTAACPKLRPLEAQQRFEPRSLLLQKCQSSLQRVLSCCRCLSRLTTGPLDGENALNSTPGALHRYFGHQSRHPIHPVQCSRQFHSQAAVPRSGCCPLLRPPSLRV